MPTRAAPGRVTPAFIRELKRLPGPHKVFDTLEDRLAYAYDGTFETAVPEVVVKPTTAEQVAATLRFAGEAGVPVVPRGAGTNLSGGAVPLAGGVVLCLMDMNRILEIRPQDSLAVVEAGVVTAHLHREVEKAGLFYPPDPSSAGVSSIGGNVAECAGGPRGINPEGCDGVQHQGGAVRRNGRDAGTDATP